MIQINLKFILSLRCVFSGCTVTSRHPCIISLYRSPTGNFRHFLQTLDGILLSLNSRISHTIICGDTTVNNLIDNNQKKNLNNMLLSHNLTNIINFPTRITNSSASAIDNIFLNITCFEDYYVFPIKMISLIMMDKW